jgi:hypothetical protein
MMVDLAADELDRVYERIGHKQAPSQRRSRSRACHGPGRRVAGGPAGHIEQLPS